MVEKATMESKTEATMWKNIKKTVPDTGDKSDPAFCFRAPHRLIMKQCFVKMSKNPKYYHHLNRELISPLKISPGKYLLEGV